MRLGFSMGVLAVADGYAQGSDTKRLEALQMLKAIVCKVREDGSTGKGFTFDGVPLAFTKDWKGEEETVVMTSEEAERLITTRFYPGVFHVEL